MSGGVRSFFAFWMGGASAVAGTPAPTTILGGVVRGEIAWGGIITKEMLDRLRRLNERRDRGWRRERDPEIRAALQSVVDEAVGRLERVGSPPLTLPPEPVARGIEIAPRLAVLSHLDEHINDIGDAYLIRVYREILERERRMAEDEEDIELLLLH